LQLQHEAHARAVRGVARSGIAVMIFSYCDAARYTARGRARAPMQLFLK
jgi:hypothetical protein